VAFRSRPVEAGRIDAGHRIARHDLPGGDVGRGVHFELQRDRQFGEVDVVAFEHYVIPRAAVDDFAGDVLLAALAEGARQIGGFYAETSGQEHAIAGDVRDERHAAAAHVLAHDDRTLAGMIQLEYQG